MAVVVQRFLRAERSGVMFTRFAGPDGEQCILVEHVEGDCEKLVKGEVSPERLWLSEAKHVRNHSKDHSDPNMPVSWPRSPNSWRKVSVHHKTWSGSFMTTCYT